MITIAAAIVIAGAAAAALVLTRRRPDEPHIDFDQRAREIQLYREEQRAARLLDAPGSRLP